MRLIRDGEKGGRGYGGGGRGKILYLSLHCYHQNDSCIKIGNDESHFNVSLIVGDKVTRRCPQTTTLEAKGGPKQIRTEVPLLTSQPNWLQKKASRKMQMIYSLAHLPTCYNLTEKYFKQEAWWCSEFSHPSRSFHWRITSHSLAPIPPFWFTTEDKMFNIWKTSKSSKCCCHFYTNQPCFQSCDLTTMTFTHWKWSILFCHRKRCVMDGIQMLLLHRSNSLPLC